MGSIFVECRIQAPLDRVWELTQRPELHERWDLRFTSIDYLSRQAEEAQRFRYETRIGLGLRIAGEGETVGEANRPDGTRTSALRFWSNEPLSLIQEGSGFWQYEPDGEGTRFRTRYDYRVRYGALGRAADLVFRPLIGWATAWSFDALRLWAERGIRPEESRRLALVHGISRATLAFVWLYHGLVPKLLFPESGEVEISTASGIPLAWARGVNTLAGVAECLVGLVLLALPRWRLPLVAQIPVLFLLVIPLAIRRPDLLVRPFGPVTLNGLMIALCLGALIASKELPRARNCLRRPV